MRLKPREFVTVFKKTIRDWLKSDPVRESSVIAYYSVFSIPALLVLIINVAALFYEREQIRDVLNRQIKNAISEKTAENILNAVDSATEFDKGWISTAIGVAVILVPANQEFDNPLTLTLVYGGRGCDVPQPTTLDVFRLRTNPPHGHQLVQNPVSDEAAESITVEVDHFTTFSIAR